MAEGAKELCQAEWILQGPKMLLENTPENKRDFENGCADGVESAG